MIRILSAAAVLCVCAASSVFGGNYKKIDAIPALQPMEDSAWVILYRDKDRSSKGVELAMVFEKKKLIDVPDNSMSFVKVPLGVGKLFADGENHTTEFACMDIKPGKIYFVQIEVREIRNSEMIALDLLMPEEAVAQLDDDDNVNRVKFLVPNGDEEELMKDRKWDRVMKKYQDWLEDSEEDYTKYMAYTGFDTMFQYDFSKKH